MAVRLRNVSTPAEEPAEIPTGFDEALRPSGRILGGRLADKLGSRMGLRLSEEHFVPEQRSGTSAEDVTDPSTRVVGWPSVPTARA